VELSERAPGHATELGKGGRGLVNAKRSRESTGLGKGMFKRLLDMAPTKKKFTNIFVILRFLGMEENPFNSRNFF
jgi:hypothetical protein